jgi:type II restriction/modification system DNA methylase subunit YeeA
MWRNLKPLARYLVTPRVAKHRLFTWAYSGVVPDSRLFSFAKDDDTFCGILQSQIHVAWALAIGSRHGDGDGGGRPTYNNETCFGTFPFPAGLTPNIPAAAYAADPRAIAIAETARELDRLRENWLNPPDLVDRVREVVPGYPDRILPKNPEAAAILKKRTLTNLYNERPTWLANAHRDLDAAVAAAYGWPADIAAEEALSRLLALNLERAAAGR